ncbi:MAG: hypothetical protein C4526_01490 [Nitrospiraceae bacterium]|nr:MAG: hypothetical protein C4526_01490 [Nitrospiraceae bacterium]
MYTSYVRLDILSVPDIIFYKATIDAVPKKYGEFFERSGKMNLTETEKEHKMADNALMTGEKTA